MAELLKCYYPRLVELHNYASASSLNAKKENWSTLNRKVLVKLDMKLNKDVIHHLANASPGSIEKLLWELRTKILAEGEGLHRSGFKCNTEDVGIKSSSNSAFPMFSVLLLLLLLGQLLAASEPVLRYQTCLLRAFCPQKRKSETTRRTKMIRWIRRERCQRTSP